MAIICNANEDHVGAPAEQSFVVLFQCYTTAVPSYMAPDPIVDADEATEEADSSNAAKAVDNAARWVGDKGTAVIMQQIAERSFEASGWPGGRSRQSYGAGNGCNWKSPITGLFSRQANIWTVQSYPDEKLGVFRRSPTQVLMELKRASTLESESRGKLILNLLKDVGIPGGTWVYPIIEMTRDGKPHHLRYDRLPIIGPWKERDLAYSWALFIGWQDGDDRWLSQYLCASQVYRVRRQPKTGSP